MSLWVKKQNCLALFLSQYTADITTVGKWRYWITKQCQCKLYRS